MPRFYPTVELAPGAVLSADPLTYSWTDLTLGRYVHEPAGISITRGRQNRNAVTAPSSCALTLLNPSGIWVPDNPLSPYYGLIDQNTPLRVLCRPNDSTASDAFGRTVASGWGTADVGGSWTNTGGSASDFSVTSGVGRHTHPTVLIAHYTSLAFSLIRVDIRVRIRVNATSTGGTQSPGVFCRFQDTSNHKRAVLEFGTDSSISLKLISRSGGSDTTLATAATGLTHNTSSWYWLRLQTGQTSVRAKAWLDGTSEPATWLIDSNTALFTNPVAGSAGCWSRRDASNSNASAQMDFDNFSLVDGPRIQFTGYVDQWPTEWADASERQAFAPITASGRLRLIGQGKPIKSAAYRANTMSAYGTSPRPMAYWPLEDPSGSMQFNSGLSGQPPGYFTDFSPGADSSIVGSESLPTVGGAGIFNGVVSSYTPASQWAVRFVAKVPALPSVSTGLLAWTTDGTIPVWEVVLHAAGTFELRGYNTSGVNQLSGVTANFTDGNGVSLYGRPVYVTVDGSQSGGNIAWSCYIVGSDGEPNPQFVSGSVAGTIGNVTRISHSAAPGLTAGGHVLGHIAVAADNSYNIRGSGLLNGRAGETTKSRLERLCLEENITAYVGEILVGPGTTVQRMGPQRTSDLLAQLRDVEATEEGILFDGKQGHLTLLPRKSRQNHTVNLALDHNLRHLKEGFSALRDDALLRTEVTVNRPSGGRGAVASDTAAIAQVGVYSESLAINPYEDPDLAQRAAWRLNVGSTRELRYPQISLELTRHQNLISSWADCDIGSRITVANLPAGLPPDSLDLLVEGYTEFISSTLWSATINCSPARPWNVHTVEGGGNAGRLGTAGSKLGSAQTSGATSLPVATTTGPQWSSSSVPYDVGISGERITVTAVADRVSDTFGRSVASGWGSTGGMSWTVSGGSASDYNVSAGVGTQSQGTVGVLRTALLDIGASDVDYRADMSIPVTNATGASITQWVCGRVADLSNYYIARLDLTTGGVVSLGLHKRVGGTLTQLVAQTSLAASHVSGEGWRVRLQIIGTAIKARAWLTSGSEPAGWQVETTDTDLTVGTSIGLLSRLETGNTNTLPVVISFDNVVVTNPQTFTVTRAVNSVVKALPSGADVRLWKPGRVAL